MPRKGMIEKREVVSDPKCNSLLVAKFINCLMKQGKKSLAQSILYGAFDIMEKKTQEDPLALFRKAIENVKPVVEVRSRRVGGSLIKCRLR